MPLRNTVPITIEAIGLSDAVDGSNAFRGAMNKLQNLVPSQDTRALWVCRPAATKLTDFSGFSSPGFVSASLVIGDIEYGLVASSYQPGKDQPFAYNLKTGLFLTVNGIVSGNVPTSPASSGDWVPPIMSLVGTRVVVTHPGFPGGAVKFGWFDISSFSATISVTTNGTTTLTSATNLLQAGVQPGQTVTKGDIPGGTTIVSIASNGLSAVLSASATGSSTANAVFAGGTPTAPLWGAGDTNINNLPSVPVSVAQFNGRAYFACDGGVLWSDSLQACNRTNANQAVTFGNGLPVTALGALPLSSPITGGIIQAIIAFQGISALQQITGDQATSNFSTNQMNVATGTLAPLSISPTNQGLAFISPEGLRLITFSATVTDPIGDSGNGVTIPFLYAVHPSRICAAASADVLRISVIDGSDPGPPSEEYWYDMTRKIWSGPHTFPASLIQPWGNTFVTHPVGVPATTFESDVQISATSSFTENGVMLSWEHRTTLLPDNEKACMNAVIESTVAVSLPSGYNLTVQAVDEGGNNLNTVPIITGGTLTLWNGFNWGGANWSSGSLVAFRQYRVPWTQPLVFKQASHIMQGSSVAGVKIGNVRVKVQELGYELGDPYVATPFPTKPFILDDSLLDSSDVLA
jgi:hypothetical protein